VAAYPAWKPPEETQRLYAGFLEPLDFDATFEVVKEIIESPRLFAPPVGVIISSAREKMRLAELDRRLSVPRKYTPGEVRHSGKGQKFVADANGDLRPEPSSARSEDLNTRSRAS
jgi:hypothetical protein